MHAVRRRAVKHSDDCMIRENFSLFLRRLVDLLASLDVLVIARQIVQATTEVISPTLRKIHKLLWSPDDDAGNT